ncbi:MAG TPA: cytochrome C oxidase subunit IV family protein [Gemmatimonadales bacterium]|nr:cytochrome C oxidase subunit IV family protein [Gemmatimonadales bacterium]
MTTISGHITQDLPRAQATPSGVMPYRTYWVSWGVLLALTAVMLYSETVPLARLAAVSLLVVAMFVKAGVISAWFMHLKFEKAALVAAVVGSTLLTAAVLFALIAPDGAAMLRNAAQ